MRPRSWIPCVAFFLNVMGAPQAASAQTVSGTVVDEFGEPVPEARLLLRLDAAPTHEFDVERLVNGQIVLSLEGYLLPHRP